MKCVAQLSKTGILLCIVLFSIAPVPSVSADIVHTLGDLDFFGFGAGVYGADNIPAFEVDNRDPGDPLFTDHDVRDSVLGPDFANDVDWFHDMSAFFPGTVATDVTLELALAGIQDLIQDGVVSPEFDDRIFVEGIEIPAALDAVDQGPAGTGIFQFALSEAQITSFATDGILNIEFDGGRRDRDGALESYFIDYSRVIVAVPEPCTTSFLIFLSTFCLLGRRRKS